MDRRTERRHRTLPADAAAARRIFAIASPRCGTTRRCRCRWSRPAALFYQRNTGLQKQAAICLREPGRDPDPVVVLDPNALSPDGSTALMAYRALARCAAAGIHARGGWRRLADGARARPGRTARPRRSRPLDAILRARLDARQQGLLLFALSRAAARQDARGGARRPRALLPPPRHAAGRGPPDLRAARSAVLVRQRHGQRRRAIPADCAVRGCDQQQPAVRRWTWAIRTIPTCARPCGRWSSRTAPSTRRSALPARRCSSDRTRRRRTGACSRSISTALPTVRAWSFRRARKRSARCA